jgi:hypothetical protein
MNVDIQVVLWGIGGILTAGAMMSGYLYRELKEADKTNTKELSEFKTHVAATYTPRSETDRMIDLVRQDIKNTAEDIKDFIDAKLGGK